MKGVHSMRIMDCFKNCFKKNLADNSSEDFTFPTHSAGHPLNIDNEPSPVVICLEKALEQVPDDTAMSSVELHWPHSNTGFQPIIVINCEDGKTIQETFSLFKVNINFEEWTSKILFELMTRTGHPLYVSYDAVNPTVTFSVTTIC